MGELWRCAVIMPIISVGWIILNHLEAGWLPQFPHDFQEVSEFYQPEFVQ
jgi:hypothetical protein